MKLVKYTPEHQPPLNRLRFSGLYLFCFSYQLDACLGHLPATDTVETRLQTGVQRLQTFAVATFGVRQFLSQSSYQSSRGSIGIVVSHN